MASISKLSIRGVRSFSPDDAEQVVEFYFPCTIIVGANGCGKTTIIESLKFAVSGAMPPGNKSGQAFVHDPRSVGQTVVKANIKLRFTGRAGSSMVVVRSMEVQQKKTTMSFKQLDGVLRSTDEDGNRVSIGHKCSELDRQLPMLLGVSRAILEHVVFCHQEDSSWPLQEGAVLKKRFDDIFDSTRYSKALDVFAKLKKDYAAQVKDLKADVAGYSSHRHAAKGFRQELSHHAEQMEHVEEDITEQKEALKESEEERVRLEKVMEQLDEINTELEARRTEEATERKLLKQAYEMVQEDLTKHHSISELKKMEHDFEAKIDHQVEEKDRLAHELKDARDQLTSIQKKDTDLREKLVRLETSKEANAERLKLRYEKMVELGNTYSLGDVFTQSQLSQTQNTSMDDSRLEQSSVVVQQDPILDIPNNDLEDFRKAVEKKEDELRQALKDQRAKARQEYDESAAHIAQIKAQLQSISTRRDELQKDGEKFRNEMAYINREIQEKGMRIRRSDVEESRQQADRIARERDQADADPRKAEIGLELRDMETKVDTLRRDIEDDRMTLKYLRQTSDAQKDIAVLKSQCSKDLEMLEETIRESSYMVQQVNISSFPDKLPGMEDCDGTDLRATVEKLVDEISTKHEACQTKLDRANLDVSKLQQSVSERSAVAGHERRSRQSRKARMSDLEGPGGAVEAMTRVVEELQAFEAEQKVDTPRDIITDARPEELLAYIGRRLEEADSESLEGIGIDAVKKIIKRLMKQSEVSEVKYVCPCCRREFLNEDEFKDFKSQMKMLRGENSSLLQFDERNKAARSNYARWKSVVSENSQAVLEYRRIANEVHEMDSSLLQLDRAISESTQQLHDAREKASESESEITPLRELLDAAKRWAEAASRIAEKRMQVRNKTSDLSAATIDAKGRDLETVEREINERTEERERYNNKISRLNKEHTALMSRANQLAESAHKSEKNARAKEDELTKQERLTERRRELGEMISNCTAEDKKLQEDLAPIAGKLNTKEKEQDRVRKLNEDEEQSKNTTLNTFVGAAKDLQNVENEIKKYETLGVEGELARLAERSGDLTRQAAEETQRIATLQPKQDTVTKALEDQELYRKNLEENIKLMNSTQRAEELAREIAVLEDKTAQVDGSDTVDDDMESVRSKRESIMTMIARLEGRRGEILESIRSVKRKLSAPEYRSVDEDYRVAMIKYETTQMAVKDLEKYHKALDKALLKFHSLKIAEINTIIRDLWNLTYKGGDISSIEIVSGQESGSRSTRSYNYRVVMTKGSTQLDMRGRCSAGQRVLASIVIRLALAETFCVNFGCIALDEPTVNLDYENKRGLATALAQIIASRAQQSNFQLVLITHDEDFVSMMKTELSAQSGFQLPEKYFQVRREQSSDGKYYSKIDAIDWDELV